MSILEVKNLKVHFPVKPGLFSREREFVKAVDGVSFDIAAGETLGLVGESGCGKSTLGRAIMRLVEPTDGQVFLDGEDITKMRGSALRSRRRRFQMIFQDPFGSLNPRMTVEQIVGEALDIHRLTDSKPARQKRISELLKDVGLDPVYAQRYPHEFSGGQRQRIGIARALAVEPELIICDEPVSALDVSVQAQIINLLRDLQQQRGIAYLFVAHDLAVVEHISHRVMVMYLGKIVETADAKNIIRESAASLHPGADLRRAGSGCRIPDSNGLFCRVTCPHQFIRPTAARFIRAARSRRTDARFEVPDLSQYQPGSICRLPFRRQENHRGRQFDAPQGSGIVHCPLCSRARGAADLEIVLAPWLFLTSQKCGKPCWFAAGPASAPSMEGLMPRILWP